jgi:glycosidase
MAKSLSDPEIKKLLENPAGVSFPSPEDWRDHWIYFLLVDRFNNPITPPNPATYPCNVYQGGTFDGIISQLPYLRKMGVGAIWISPVQYNPQWFKDYWGGYGLQNFLRIEPRFCRNPPAAEADPAVADKEFRDLVDKAHKQGIYVILDIVFNHVGNLFNYNITQDSAVWNDAGEYAIHWKDQNGTVQSQWDDISGIPGLTENEGIWPKEFQQNDFFRRRGDFGNSGDITKGDFGSLKELVTEYLIPGTRVFPVRDFIIKAYQYLIARFDLDGFRIDTLQYVEPEFGRIFGNAIREFALSIGKKNFFTFGEIWIEDNEELIAEFVGRDTHKDQHSIGIDAAIDFPMRKRLFDVCKGFRAPVELAAHFNYRKEVLKKTISSHGDAGAYYVTFIDNHDIDRRFHNKQFPAQTRLILTCLMTMQGIPCIYQGIDQGFDGFAPDNDRRREYVRETLWGKPGSFSIQNDFYKLIRQLSGIRNLYPALRYGRQYFRECSGNGTDFGFSPFPGGVISYSRILNDKEMLVCGNSNTTQNVTVFIVVDENLNPAGRKWKIIFSSANDIPAPVPTTVFDRMHTVKVTLAPMEAKILM